MPDRLKRARKRLREIEDLLDELRPKRVKRRANDAEDNKEDTQEARERQLDRQVDAHRDLERAERQLERLLDDGEDEDSPTVKELVREIRELEREIEARQKAIAQKWDRQQRQGKRFHDLEDLAKRQAERQRNLQGAKHRVLKRIDEIEKNRAQERWPDSMVLDECIYHLGHFHLASRERAKLIVVCRILQDRGIRIGEFPPFETVESVHVDPGSWHYRNSSDWWIARSFANRGDGLATDINDADGGTDKEWEAYLEVKRRYG